MSLTNRPVVHVDKQELPAWMKPERTRVLTKKETTNKSSSSKSSVVYWMQRDVRTRDNWALSLASWFAKKRGIPLHVLYALPPPLPNAAEAETDDHGNELAPTLEDLPMTERYGKFLLGGLECVSNELANKNVPLHVVMADSHATVGRSVCNLVLDKLHADLVICDFSPLRHARQWLELQAAPLLDASKVPLIQVDAHNVVPVWIASNKREVGARTLRPRIHRQIQDYLKAIPEFTGNNKGQIDVQPFARKQFEQYMQMDTSVPAVDCATPGTDAGMKQFRRFCQNGLKHYDSLRNDPTQTNICSDLSPWINHGHISFPTIVLQLKNLNKYANGTASYMEEGVVRRELSDNFLFYAPNDYDALESAAGWAQETLQVHAADPREHLYSLSELERGETYDDLWNAAQLQQVREGRMHGFLRMYWCKKILEWSPSPLVALRAAQYLNDMYALDGRDPNGFVGVGWSVMGIHDMGWKERPIFGKIRFMNYNGCKRKFKVPVFVNKYKGAAENAAKALKKEKAASRKRPRET